MASVFKRPGNRWYARYKDARGAWISRRVRQENRRSALRVAQALEAKAERQRVGLEAPDQAGQLCGPLMRRWAVALKNRSADIDRGRIDLHVLPRWRNVRVSDVDVGAIIRWLDDMRKAQRIGPGSRRHALALLSRFMSWCVEEEHAQRNPVRDVPASRRPRVIAPRREEVPWIQTDADVLRVMKALPPPFDAAFYVGNRCGARLGEILGLRIGDLDQLDDGVIHVAHSYDGPLKEDRHGDGKEKWVPAPSDASAVLAPVLAQRRAAGAGPDALVFVDRDGDAIDRHQVAHRWRVVRKALGLPAGLSFYKATRHSACSRALASGASVDEVAAALGHASPTTTLRHYAHHRPRFSAILRAGLGLDGAPGAKVIPMAGRTQVTDTAAAPETEGQVAHG